MIRLVPSLCAFLVLAAGCEAPAPAPGEAPPASPAGAPTPESIEGTAAPPIDGAAAEPAAAEGAGPPAEPLPTERVELPDRVLPRPVFEQPAAIRGIYVNAWAAGSSRRMEQLVELARRTEVNSFVIDVKDASGYVSYRTGVALAREIGADGELRIRDVRALLHRLAAEGVYPIARIVVFKDPILAGRWSEVAVQDSTGAPWVDGRGDRWVNPHDERVWDYHVELAREAVELGFAEIQWDYVRFPDRPHSEMALAVFPGADRPRSRVIRAFLIHAADRLADLDVPIGADVFGVATTFTMDPGIGQLWEDFIDVVDVALPMVYPSHYYEGSYGFGTPNAHPYEVVRAALADAVRRTEGVEGAGRVIPWLQDFTLGEPRYGPAEVRAQILAARDVGLDEWILWNASSRYTEAALEPAEGWPGQREPAIRLGNRIVPAEARLYPPAETAPREDGDG